jgi:prepilin peptidase CpaA
MKVLEFLPYAPLLGLLVLAAAIDARHRRIPNWLTFGLILAGLARAAVGAGDISLGGAFLGVFVGAAAPLVLFVLGALGGGDVKLLAAIGAWLGAKLSVEVFVVECVVGMVIVLIQAVGQGRTLTLFRNSAALACSIAHQGIAASAETGKSFTSIDRPLPYAVPVALATLFVLAMRIVGG